MRLLSTEREYLSFLERDKSGQEMVRFLDAISTNFTSFFREADHFGLLEEEVRGWLEKGAKKLRIWCAAAATGEEPYSLAMTLSESVGHAPVEWKLLGHGYLRDCPRCRRGRRVPEPAARAGAPCAARALFHRRGGQRGRRAAVSREERAALADPVSARESGDSRLPGVRGELDAVFCRNVMIYFDNAVRQRLVTELERLLRPGGLLVVAHAETLNGIRSNLRAVRASRCIEQVEES